MRKPIIIGNWKMYKTAAETEKVLVELKEKLKSLQGVDVVVCPPFTALHSARNALKESEVHLGAQNMFWEKEGAFTGEIAAPMLVDAGCRFVILGHSERRQFFGETDLAVNKKIRTAFEAGLKPIMCVGETLEERKRDQTQDVCLRQVLEGLKGISEAEVAGLIIAYEPVWAIGTGITASPEDAQEVICSIRKIVGREYGEQASLGVRILYGGSVNPSNIAQLMAQPDIDGALVGGASLEAEKFFQIANYNRQNYN